MPTAPTLTIDNWEAANQDLDRRFVAAMSTKDIERAMSCFIDSPDLLAVLWGRELRALSNCAKPSRTYSLPTMKSRCRSIAFGNFVPAIQCWR